MGYFTTGSWSLAVQNMRRSKSCIYIKTFFYKCLKIVKMENNFSVYDDIFLCFGYLFITL